MRISDWSSDVCSSDLPDDRGDHPAAVDIADQHHGHIGGAREAHVRDVALAQIDLGGRSRALDDDDVALAAQPMIAFENLGHQRAARFAEIAAAQCAAHRSEEHTSELQSLMRISYAVFCLKKKKHHKYTTVYTH